MAQPSSPVPPPAVPCRNGILGWLWSLMGSTTPTYSGTGQPAPGRGWCGWFSTTPTYQVGTREPPPKDDDDQTQQGTVNIVIRRE
jgi:hypothetical protein